MPVEVTEHDPADHDGWTDAMRAAIDRVLADALEASQPAVDAAGHRIVLDLPPVPLRVRGDLTRLAQVFGNLVNNASKYTPAGGRIEVSLRGEAGEAVVDVRDNGSGIEPDMLMVWFGATVAVEMPESEVGSTHFRLLFLAGLFEQPYADAAQADAQTATTADVALAREAAGRSVVLLSVVFLWMMCVRGADILRAPAGFRQSPRGKRWASHGVNGVSGVFSCRFPGSHRAFL